MVTKKRLIFTGQKAIFLAINTASPEPVWRLSVKSLEKLTEKLIFCLKNKKVLGLKMTKKYST
jgi:hypothetical protein